MKNFELFMGCLGNGLTVCNKAVMENGDYKKVAHISNGGNITWYVSVDYVPGDALLRIEHEANVMAEKFKAEFEALPILHQYDKMLNEMPFSDMLEMIKDKRDVAIVVEEMKPKYFKRM